MKILYLGVFEPHCSDPFRVKGFEQADIEYRKLDFRALIANKRKIINFIKELKKIKNSFTPDLVMVNKGDRFSQPLIKKSRHILGNEIPWALFFGDKRTSWPPFFKTTLKEYDHLLINSKDIEENKKLKEMGAKNIVYHHSGVDLDTFYKTDDEEEYDIGFFGGNYKAFPESETRRKWISRLALSHKVLVHGPNWPKGLAQPVVYGEDFSKEASKCKILLGFNAFNDINLYTSNRTFNSMACGFYMSHTFKGCETLFRDKDHLRYFNSYEELKSLVDFYLARPEERKKIHLQGRKELEINHTYKARAESLKELI